LKRAAKSGSMAAGQTLPEGTKIISIPVVEMAPNNDSNQQV